MALFLGSFEAGFGVEKRSAVSSRSAGFDQAPRNPSIVWPTKTAADPCCAVWCPLCRRRQLTLMTAERDGLQRQVEEQTRAAHQLQELVSPQHSTQHSTGSHHEGGLVAGFCLGFSRQILSRLGRSLLA